MTNLVVWETLTMNAMLVTIAFCNGNTTWDDIDCDLDSIPKRWMYLQHINQSHDPSWTDDQWNPINLTKSHRKEDYHCIEPFLFYVSCNAQSALDTHGIDVEKNINILLNHPLFSITLAFDDSMITLSIINHHYSLLAFIIDQFGNVSDFNRIMYEQSNALHHLCRQPIVSHIQMECIQQLIHLAGPSINAQTKQGGHTALHVAIRFDNMFCAELLLEHSHLNPNTKLFTSPGLNALQYAVWMNKAKFVALIMSVPDVFAAMNVLCHNQSEVSPLSAFQLSAINAKTLNIFQLFLHHPRTDIHQRTSSGMNILQLVAAQGTIDAFEVLADYSMNEFKYLALDRPVIHGKCYGILEFISYSSNPHTQNAMYELLWRHPEVSRVLQIRYAQKCGKFEYIGSLFDQKHSIQDRQQDVAVDLTNQKSNHTRRLNRNVCSVLSSLCKSLRQWCFERSTEELEQVLFY
eukprot:87832_1